MAYKFKCIDCGDVSYSAAPLELQKSVRCEKCGGIILRVQPPMKLGEILVALGMTNEKDIEKALMIQHDMSEHLVLGKLLVKLNFVNKVQLESALKLQREMMGGSTSQ